VFDMMQPPVRPSLGPNPKDVKERHKSGKVVLFESNVNIEKDHCRKLNSYEILGIVLSALFVIAVVVIRIFFM